MTGFNLLPWRARRRRAVVYQGLATLAAVCLLAVAMLAVCAHDQRQRLQQQESVNAAWTARLQTLDRTRQQAADDRQTLEDVMRRRAELSALRRGGGDLPDMLGSLERAIPPGLRLTALTFERQRLLVSGQAPSGLLIAELMRALQALPQAEAVTLQDVQAQGDAQVFRVSLDVRGSRP